MQTIVVKFGGSSLASAEQYVKVANIIKADPARRFVVASAPGKRFDGDVKVTDLLYKCFNLSEAGEDFEPVLAQIKERFGDIINELNIDFDIQFEIDRLRRHIVEGTDKEYMASRGEYLNSKILAAYLGFDFIDPCTCIFFNEDGSFNAEDTNYVLGKILREKEHAVVAGFYGARPSGKIYTFSRGGSDVTGSIVARAANADLYENWTDVSGMMAADPRVVENPKTISYISYTELRELSYMGASVLHEDAVFPVRKAGIPINIRNTNAPEDDGTMIMPTIPKVITPSAVTGIAGKKGFTVVHVEKSSMNGEVGFGAKLLQIFADFGVPFEHCPTGIDTMSVVVSTELLAPVRDAVMASIKAKLKPDILIANDGLAIVAVVGMGMAYSRGVVGRVCNAIANQDVIIKWVDSNEMNIIINVDEADYEKAVIGVYNEFFG